MPRRPAGNSNETGLSGRFSTSLPAPTAVIVPLACSIQCVAAAVGRPSAPNSCDFSSVSAPLPPTSTGHAV
ncbi:Uncharacterised protein [Mycobacteroides abscessus subsp. abscessus]|nr:Uncharacterised protein [Mycobacteroides abscessus subsp. abscessus]